MMNIGAKIKTLRTTHNLSQRDFAALVNRNHALISRWEKDRACPSVPMLMDICKIFDIDINYFFT